MRFVYPPPHLRFSLLLPSLTNRFVILFAFFCSFVYFRSLHRTTIPNRGQPLVAIRSCLNLLEFCSVEGRSGSNIFRLVPGLVSKKRSGVDSQWCFILFVLTLKTLPDRYAIPDQDRPPVMARSGLNLFEVRSVTVRSSAITFQPSSGMASKSRSGVNPWFNSCCFTSLHFTSLDQYEVFVYRPWTLASVAVPIVSLVWAGKLCLACVFAMLSSYPPWIRRSSSYCRACENCSPFSEHGLQSSY